MAQTYKVQSGDSLSKIAKQYGVKVSDISGYRSGNPNLIYPNEVLNIGGNVPQTTTPTPPPLYPSGSLGNLLNTPKIPSTAQTSANVSSVIQPTIIQPTTQKPVQPPTATSLTTIGQQYLKARETAGKSMFDLDIKKEYRDKGFEEKYGSWTGSNEQYKAMWMQDIQEGITQLQDKIAKEGITDNQGRILQAPIDQPPQENQPSSVSTSGAGTPSYEFNAPSVDDHEKTIQGILDATGTTDIGKIIEETAGGKLDTPELELSKEDRQAQLDELKSAAAKGLSSIQKSLAQRGMTFSGIRTEEEASFAADVLAKESGITRDFAGKIINAARQEQGRREKALEAAETNYNEALKSQGYVFNPITNTIEMTLEGKKFALDVYEAGKEKPVNAPASYDEWEFAGGKEETGMSYAEWLDRNETEKTQMVSGNLYTQDQTGQWRLTIQGKDSSSETPLIKSGGLKILESDIAKAQQLLDSRRGDDGFADTGVYLQLLKDWKNQGGLEQDFFKEFDPKNYLRYGDPTVPQYIKDNYLKKPKEEEETLEEMTAKAETMGFGKPGWSKWLDKLLGK